MDSRFAVLFRDNQKFVHFVANITRHQSAARFRDIRHTRLQVETADSRRMEIKKNQTNAGVVVTQKSDPSTGCDGFDQHHNSKMIMK